MRDIDLEPFQAAAIDLIVARLESRAGSLRFLLADEVGLGKTIVAGGVIRAMAAKRRSRTFRVVYLCSNAEIADQNAGKLVDDKDRVRPIGRVSELAVERAPSGDGIELYALTPGTSLRGGTGLAWERRLLLYFVHRIYGEPIQSADWREFFRCSAGRDGWTEKTTEAALRRDFGWRIRQHFQDLLARVWAEAECGGQSLPAALRRLAAGFAREGSTRRGERTRLVAQMRGLLQRVAIRRLAPDLVILDEVQRFRDVIDNAEDREHIAFDLLQGVPVLILSATPYRWLTQDGEAGGGGTSHHEEFFKTLRFLYGRGSPAPGRVQRRFEEFRERLQILDPEGSGDGGLVALKRGIEKDLKKVLCRTERSRYFLDASKGVDEAADDVAPRPEYPELEEYFRLSRGLGAPLGDSAQVAEFWKSAPSFLTFLDGSYSLHRRLSSPRVRVPRALLTRSRRVLDLVNRNHRLQRAVRLTLGEEGRRPTLWTRPTYTYWRDEYFGDDPPRKLLVFSGWRFVPKAVGIVASALAAARLKGAPTPKESPLRFASKGSFHVFDVCFPSPALAAIVSPLSPGVAGGSLLEVEAVLEAAVEGLRGALRAAGVDVRKSGGAALWRVVARLESHRGYQAAVRNALDGWTAGEDEDEPARSARVHAERFGEWLADTETPLCIGEKHLHRLARVAMFSPAVSLLRTLLSVYAEGPPLTEALPPVARLCLGAMRAYLNRPVTQSVIRGHRPRWGWRPVASRRRTGYAAQILRYAADAHLQAVLDEYVYMQSSGGRQSSVADTCRRLEGIWTRAQGKPRTNAGQGTGPRVRLIADRVPHRTHFGLAFGDEEAADDAPGEERGRMKKSTVRDAFNSPFWPFILATTSVGQEGLDFHLYCRDVMHWNLPWNPVDIEQREGRINRRDCLAVRASIARDWPLQSPRVASRLASNGGSLWGAVFDSIKEEERARRYRHGLFPHWIYECGPGKKTVWITRHVPLFRTSQEADHYEKLKVRLALYRLAFGQADQEDFLDRLDRRIEGRTGASRELMLKRLAGYMLNLSPIDRGHALRQSAEIARSMLEGEKPAVELDGLLSDVTKLRRERASELASVARELGGLMGIVEHFSAAGDFRSPVLSKAVSVLEYLRDPYDQYFDFCVDYGFEDDVEVIREAWKKLRCFAPARTTR